jgi:hypothetical protein
MTEPNEYVDAAAEKLTDGEMVERVAHPTDDSSEPAGEDREAPSPQAPEE